MTDQELSREALYEMVWSGPMAAFAQELGITDVGLAKRCRKMGIPTPRRGYWTKLAAGDTVIKPKAAGYDRRAVSSGASK